jgi:hypothetical protein
MRHLALLLCLIVFGTAPAGAQPAPPDVTDLEFKCMRGAAKGEAKFVQAKPKCISKCLGNYWKGLIPTTADCFPPYGGITAFCINDTSIPGRSAESRFEAYMLKYCVLASGADCPECYASGDCTTAATDRVQNVEGAVDSVIPGIVCETAGAEPLEQRCQLRTLKTFGKYYASAVKCYTSCFQNARSDGTPVGDCIPPSHGVPVTDGRTHGCLTSSRAKASATIHKYCHDTSTPEAPPECGPDPYPDGDYWVDLIDQVVEGTFLPSYCAD